MSLEAETDPPAARPAGLPPAPPKQSLVEIVRRAPMSALIVAINVAVFVVAERAGDTTKTETLVRFGAVWRQLVWHGQYWRLATSMFLHIGLVHLVWNSWMGFRISAVAEGAIGRGRFIALYLLSGILAAATSVIGHDAVSAGASGALFGLIGWRLVALRMRLGSFKAFTSTPGIRQELVWIAIWFALGTFTGFDNYAHAGGLVFGSLFAWMLYAPAGRKRIRLVVTAVAAMAGVALSLRPLPLIHAQDRLLFKAQRALDQGDPRTTVALTESLPAPSRRGHARELRVEAFLRLGQAKDALEAAEQMVVEGPGDGRAYLVRGRARMLGGDLTGAEADFVKAVELDPTPWAQQNLDWLRSHRPGAPRVP
ncbi:MAG TPA: rhomboid family intramembrane serine protease [Polyangia bacterium]|nr:rhomboid family intramembrane serine protease [Polyangia bacterium]